MSSVKESRLIFLLQVYAGLLKQMNQWALEEDMEVKTFTVILHKLIICLFKEKRKIFRIKRKCVVEYEGMLLIALCGICITVDCR